MKKCQNVLVPASHMWIPCFSLSYMIVNGIWVSRHFGNVPVGTLDLYFSLFLYILTVKQLINNQY